MTAGLPVDTVVTPEGTLRAATPGTGAPLSGCRPRRTSLRVSESWGATLDGALPLAPTVDQLLTQDVDSPVDSPLAAPVDYQVVVVGDDTQGSGKTEADPLDISLKSRLPNEDDGDSKDEIYETDGKWAWLTLIGSFYIMMTTIPITPVFGILFSKRLPELGLGQQVIGWIFTVHAVVWNTSVVVAKTIVDATSYRATAMGACLLLAVVFMLLAFAQTALHFCVLYGFLIPVAASIGSTVPYLLVPLHFNRRRGMAMGILASGISMGGILTPIAIRFLQDEYSFVGACLIHGAVLLNCCVGAAIFRAPRPKNQTLKRITTIQSISHSKTRTTSISYSPDDAPKRLCMKLKETALVGWFVTHLKLCKDPRMLLTCTSYAIALAGFSSFMSMVPFSLELHGYTKHFSAHSVSVCYISSTVARILIAFTSDRSWFNRRAVLIFATTMVSASISGLMYTPALGWLVLTLMGGAGAAWGAFIAVFHLNTLGVFGEKLYAFSVGIEAVFAAFGYAILGLMLDVIRAVVSGYTASMGLCASFLLASGSLWLLVPRAQRRVQGGLRRCRGEEVDGRC